MHPRGQLPNMDWTHVAMCSYCFSCLGQGLSLLDDMDQKTTPRERVAVKEVLYACKVGLFEGYTRLKHWLTMAVYRVNSRSQQRQMYVSEEWFACIRVHSRRLLSTLCTKNANLYPGLLNWKRKKKGSLLRQATIADRSPALPMKESRRGTGRQEKEEYTSLRIWVKRKNLWRRRKLVLFPDPDPKQNNPKGVPARRVD